MESINSEIEKLLKQAGVAGQIELSVPPKPEMGDLSFSCFNLAKEKNKNPIEIAQGLAVSLRGGADEAPTKQSHRFGNDTIERVQAAGPYLNFFLKPSAVAAAIVPEILKLKNKYGQNKSGGGKQIIVEYPSNNTHKELHIGHLRNICIGNSLVKLFEANGHKVVPINYVNDFGAHVAKCLWGLQKFHATETPPADKQKWLGEIYAEASRYLKEYEEAKTEVAEIQRRLEKDDKQIRPLFLKTRKWSLDRFAEVFKELGAKHKKTLFEKDIKQKGQKVVDALLKKGLAKKGEGGAIIVDLSQYGLDIGLLRKSDGSGLYLTSDLGLALEKNKLFPKISESVHVTGNEQNFYFKQLFKVLELAGYKFKMTHIGYGLINLPSGKISSRAGNAPLYDDVYKAVFDKALTETALRHRDWPKEKIEPAARNIAFAALKFDLLKHESAKTIVFDPASAVSFDGFTGPYVLYTVARINSLMRKVKNEKLAAKSDWNLLRAPEEKHLAFFLGQFGEAIEKSMAGYNPSVIAKYAFDLAKLFNDFYNKRSVLSAETPALSRARLALSSAAKITLENALGLLSIETVDEM